MNKSINEINQQAKKISHPANFKVYSDTEFNALIDEIEHQAVSFFEKIDTRFFMLSELVDSISDSLEDKAIQTYLISNSEIHTREEDSETYILTHDSMVKVSDFFDRPDVRSLVLSTLNEIISINGHYIFLVYEEKNDTCFEVKRFEEEAL